MCDDPVDLVDGFEQKSYGKTLLDSTGAAHGSGQVDSSSFIPESRREGDPMDADLPKAKYICSYTANENFRGSGDDDTAREPPAFHRDGWDPMGHDMSAN